MRLLDLWLQADQCWILSTWNSRFLNQKISWDGQGHVHFRCQDSRLVWVSSISQLAGSPCLVVATNKKKKKGTISWRHCNQQSLTYGAIKAGNTHPFTTGTFYPLVNFQQIVLWAFLGLSAPAPWCSGLVFIISKCFTLRQTVGLPCSGGRWRRVALLWSGRDRFSSPANLPSHLP